MFSKRFIKTLENDFMLTMLDAHSMMLFDDFSEYLIERFKTYLQVTDLCSGVSVCFDYEKEALEYLETAV